MDQSGLEEARAKVEHAEAGLREARAELAEAERDVDEAEDAIREIGGHHREIHLIVDGEPFETEKRRLTPNEIIEVYGGKDPSSHYLVQIEGDRRISYQGKGDEAIKLHDHVRFQVISTGPTPVSDL